MPDIIHYDTPRPAGAVFLRPFEASPTYYLMSGNSMNLLPVALLSILPAALAQGPSVDQIMARVAENQARAQDLRRAYIYNQKVVARFHRTNGKLAREEKLEYVVAPTPSGIEKKLAHFEGEVAQKGQIVSYTDPDKDVKGIDV